MKTEFTENFRSYNLEKFKTKNYEFEVLFHVALLYKYKKWNELKLYFIYIPLRDKMLKNIIFFVPKSNTQP
jgi:hypothetical protein